MFNTLEEIKAHCEQKFQSGPYFRIDQSQISASQVPPKRTFNFSIIVPPGLPWGTTCSALGKLILDIERSGFVVRRFKGTVQGHGYLMEVFVKDKRQPLYSPGQEVGYRAELAQAPIKFRIKDYRWNGVTRGYIYHILPSGSYPRAFSSVPEASLVKI